MVESIFDKPAEPGKGFYCVSGQKFNTIRELEEALLNCSSVESRKLFDIHTAGYKNDFAAWIGDVFGLTNLAKRIFLIKDPIELSNELRKYESEFNQKTDSQKEVQKTEVHKIEEVHNDVNKSQIVHPIQTGHNFDSVENIDALRNELNDRSDRADHTFDRVKKIKQHSFYNKADFEDSIEDINERYGELMRIVSTHRKEGLDMSIPSMMLRNVHPKIIYFQVSQNKSDHEMIIELLDDIEQEIKYAKGIKKKDLKEEILEVLGLSKKQKEE